MDYMYQVKCCGFSLIELIVSLSVASIVIGTAVPGFQNVVLENRMTTDLNRLVTDLNLTRVEAIKRGDDVTICKKNVASTDCDNNSSWHQGWIVFADPNRNGVVDLGEEIIRVNAELDAGLTLVNARDRITFTSQGFAYGFAGAFVISDSRGVGYSKTRVVSNTGRIRVG
jgi:type IV fimbrial biogenesis protein FimT